jgi:hypothetical protein
MFRREREREKEKEKVKSLVLEYEFVVNSPVSLHHAANAVVGKAVAKEFVILPARIRYLQRNLLHRELFLLR